MATRIVQPRSTGQTHRKLAPVAVPDLTHNRLDRAEDWREALATLGNAEHAITARSAVGGYAACEE